MNLVKILIVDDHHLVRHGLAQILNNVTNLVVQDTAASGPEAMQKLASASFDVVLLDISLPGRDGLDVLKDIKDKWPAIRVIMLTMYSEKQFAVRAIKNGASGYLNKNTSPEELFTAIRTVVGGRKYITPEVAEQMAGVLSGDFQAPLHAGLSDRELQVLTLIARGLSLKEIATFLTLSGKTISTYRARICDKMHIDNNADIIRYAIEQDLV
jgi:two-component system, NarL family, invasion response regulator UvrY